MNTPNFPENCMKSKEFGRPGGACVPHAPPRSANGYGVATEQRGVWKGGWAGGWVKIALEKPQNGILESLK